MIYLASTDIDSFYNVIINYMVGFIIYVLKGLLQVRLGQWRKLGSVNLLEIFFNHSFSGNIYDFKTNIFSFHQDHIYLPYHSQAKEVKNYSLLPQITNEEQGVTWIKINITPGIAIFLSVVASNKSNIEVLVQSWYLAGKSVAKTCPATEVTLNLQFRPLNLPLNSCTIQTLDIPSNLIEFYLFLI